MHHNKGVGVPKIKINEAEYDRLLKIEALLEKLFEKADEAGLYLGAGYNADLADDEQEGPLVKKLRKLLAGKK